MVGLILTVTIVFRLQFQDLQKTHLPKTKQANKTGKTVEELWHISEKRQQKEGLRPVQAGTASQLEYFRKNGNDET
jgi:hypothetical protein